MSRYSSLPASARVAAPVTARPNADAFGYRPRAFSLIEVVLAVGIFAVAITTMLALLPALTRQAAGSADSLTALRLPDAIRTELDRLAASGGLDALAAETKAMTSPFPATLTLVAARDAARIHSLDYQPPAAVDAIAPGDRFFQIETWSFNSAPLAFEPGSAVLALHVRVSWPYHVPAAATPTPLADREQVTFTLAIER